MIKCEIDMKLPSLNDYVDVCRRNRYESAHLKKSIERRIGAFVAQLPKINNPIVIHFRWIERDLRRDADNISFAKKFILDAMVKYGKIEDDSRNVVLGFTDTFELGRETKVIIEIEEVKDGTQNAAGKNN